MVQRIAAKKSCSTAIATTWRLKKHLQSLLFSKVFRLIKLFLKQRHCRISGFFVHFRWRMVVCVGTAQPAVINRSITFSFSSILAGVVYRQHRHFSSTPA
jgi:hypothetical protein